MDLRVISFKILLRRRIMPVEKLDKNINSKSNNLYFNFDNSFVLLPQQFYAKVSPIPVTNPSIITINEKMAVELRLDSSLLQTSVGIGVLAGNIIPSGAAPISMAYAGHQFGGFVPQLGDGRAILLGEVIGANGQRFDIQLKGSGITPFSRQGDGRSSLGPVIREYIISEAMNSLGICTTRALAAVTTGETVNRTKELPGAILTRVASSHIRVGSFEYFANKGDKQAVKTFADYTINRLYPECNAAPNKYIALLNAVIDSQAHLIASWMHIGFIHGVMNTDNMAISGETIDYGPCAFLDEYDPAKVFSSIDYHGRYAFANQGRIAQWNLARFAETILFLLDADQHKAVKCAENSISLFSELFENYWVVGMLEKIGIATQQKNDLQFIEQLLKLMQEHKADYTLTFRYLPLSIENNSYKKELEEIFNSSQGFKSWYESWQERLNVEDGSLVEISNKMLSANPQYIPRNHKIEQVIDAAIEKSDFSMMHEFISVLNNPYSEQNGMSHYAKPPEKHERVYQTFCGT